MKLLIMTLALVLCFWAGGNSTPAPTDPAPSVQELPTPPGSVLKPRPLATPFPKAQQMMFDPESLAEGIGRLPGHIREVVVTKSGTLKRGVIVPPNIRIRLLAGVTIQPHTSEIPFRLKEGASVIGAGMGKSVIGESSNGSQWMVIAGYYGSEKNGAKDERIVLQGFEVRGFSGHAFSSTPQAVSLGNCHNCSVDGVWINGTHSIGIQYGGAGFFGHTADNSSVTNCKFSRVASQSLALVNGQNIIFENNWLEASGQPNGPGSTMIDLEPNNADEKLRNVVIRNNWLDFRESSVYGNGILVQGVEHGPRGDNIGNILVERNVIIGGIPYGPNLSGWCSNGIYVTGPQIQKVTVRNNRVWRTGQAGIHVEGPGMMITDNEFVNVGSGGVPGGRLIGMTGTFARNTLRYVGPSLIDGRLVILGGNVTLGENPGWTVARTQ